ncbi:MAG: gamma-glutamyltransferase, partial [Nitrospinales bacterium]
MKLNKIEGRFAPTEDGKCATSSGGMVSTAFPEATQAGVEMLRLGGNAIDAAVASAFALGVCEPQASGIGGQSTAIFHFNGNTVALDGSSRVPSLAHIDRIDKKTHRFQGYKATTVPSTPALLGYLHFRYGKLDWSEVLKPAIAIAREGYRITELQHNLQKKEKDKLLSMDSLSGAKYFLKDGQEPYDVGDRFIQNDLSNM